MQTIIDVELIRTRTDRQKERINAYVKISMYDKELSDKVSRYAKGKREYPGVLRTYYANILDNPLIGRCLV